MYQQIGIAGNLEAGNSDPTPNEVLTPLLPRMMIVAGVMTLIAVVVMYHRGEHDFSVLGWSLRIVAGLALVFLGWFFTRRTSFPPDVETLAFKIEGSVSFDEVTGFINEIRKSIGVGDAILFGSEFVERLFVRVSDVNRGEFIRAIANSSIGAIRLKTTDEILRGNVPTVRVPVCDTRKL